MKKQITSTLLFIIIAVILISWGATGHRKINFNATYSFNFQMAQFLSWGSQLQNHASDADTRKDTDPTEVPKHYIDIDNYSEFSTLHRIPQTWDSIISIHGSSFVMDAGILPWATVTAYDTLVKCFQRSDWNKAILIASDMGHYVADGHMPLHITKNYDGQLTGNKGIHSRYESTMISAYNSQIIYSGDTNLNVIDNVNQYVFEYIYNSYKYKDSVLLADTYAKAVAGGDSTSSAYKLALWNKTSSYTISLFSKASHKLAELIYTAWIKAGTPSGINDTKALAVVNFEQNMPNPFTNSTNFHFYLNKNSQRIVFQIRDITGKTVAVLVDDKLNVGEHNIKWTPVNLPKGIYFAIIQSGDSTLSKKILYF
ncbi:MAG: T9SS type A sorting domain-containing protein [Bacteroidetes bacterium]|nr:T9SS type A sorting domain-containing protein [Bacteroidota bacterium]